MSFLRRNFGYKILSLAISILLYWIASGQQNPHVDTELYIQPDVTSLPADLVLRTPPSAVPVNVSGTAAAVAAYKALDKKATVDLSRARPGTNGYPVTYIAPTGYGSSIEVMGPPVTQVSLDRKVSHKFYVDVDYDHDAAPPGYAYREAKTTPASVMVEGSAADLARVVRVSAAVDTRDRQGAVDEPVTLVAQDSRLQSVEGVSIVPPAVRVTIGLRRAAATKTLLLSVDPTGAPAPGYEVTNYRFTPAALTVTGAAEILAQRSSLKVPVDIGGIRESVVKTVEVEAPEGLTLPGGRATVRVLLEVQKVATVGQPQAEPSPTSGTGGVGTAAPAEPAPSSPAPTAP